MSLDTGLNRTSCVVSECIPSNSVGLTSGKRPVIKAADQNMRDVIDLLISTTENSFNIRRFKSTLRQTPHQYQQSLKIAQATALIKQSKMPLAEIASWCGFSDQSHMSRCFRQLLDITPSQYRREIMKNMQRERMEVAEHKIC
ncbi:helix-turn-helix domain-containing protein [Delftia lacustris]|uniref:helix-turn-helix domain-containing protein n=1 Tax=Delftia lacustris TaxID=558537 RepID=UPI0035A5C371